MTLRIALAYFLFAFGGCSLPFQIGGSAKTYYLLSEASEEYRQYEHRDKHLVVREMLASGFIESHRIAFSQENMQRGYYQFASWTELPSKRIVDLLIARLRLSGMFASVSRAYSGAVADYQLNLELNEFVQDLDEGGSVRIAVNADLVSLQTRRIIGTARFASQRKLAANDAPSAVRGFAAALTELDMSIVDWIDKTVPRENS
jgi:ABC-type uncharacterized transport system auxiliary subunit